MTLLLQAHAFLHPTKKPTKKRGSYKKKKKNGKRKKMTESERLESLLRHQEIRCGKVKKAVKATVALATIARRMKQTGESTEEIDGIIKVLIQHDSKSETAEQRDLKQLCNLNASYALNLLPPHKTYTHLLSFSLS